MIINVVAYDRLGTDLTITVTMAGDTAGGLGAKREFFGRSTIPLGPASNESAADLVFAIGEELLNLAYGYANPGPARGAESYGGDPQ